MVAHSVGVARALADLQGTEIGLILVDYAITFVFFGRGREVGRIRIEGTFTLRAQVTKRFDPGRREELGPVLTLFGMIVRAATLTDEGALRLELGDSRVIEVGPRADFEAWQYSTAANELIVSTPGGEVVHFPV